MCFVGKICVSGSFILIDCIVGYYCFFNDIVRFCFFWIFNSVFGVIDISFCYLCFVGYYCWYEGKVFGVFSCREIVVYKKW